ncbi:hypothetical protein [Actinobacillus pleuropneumoniae]|uniref:hypothetical protein n=1 Tax=Actinobacillus pleuropneumoniae TaxID=715 RepID=UPI001F1C2C23|nr:hypothetical protein [Actinobacillus pleuropneumoniae]UKH19919.1 hypothetical protein D1109_01590 [Actinobacillus pleuropneumoniae]UPA21732.1 hypothetical protein JS559_04560 [Actinobacillus pleuropneumoniae]
MNRKQRVQRSISNCKNKLNIAAKAKIKDVPILMFKHNMTKQQVLNTIGERYKLIQQSFKHIALRYGVK